MFISVCVLWGFNVTININCTHITFTLLGRRRGGKKKECSSSLVVPGVLYYFQPQQQKDARMRAGRRRVVFYTGLDTQLYSFSLCDLDPFK